MKIRYLFSIMLFWTVLSGMVGKAGADYNIAVASDLHYISPRLTDGGEYYQRVLKNGDSKFMTYSEEILDAFVTEMLHRRPEAVLLTGDLTFNGAVMSHEALTEKLRSLKNSGIPVLVLTGNHDIYNESAARYEGNSFSRVPFATSELFAELYAEFGLNEALSVDSDSLSYMYPLNDSTRILMLDFNTVHDFCGLSKRTLNWVERQLQEAQTAGMSVLAAGHQNLFQHTIFRDGYVIDGADDLAMLLREYGVRLFLSGHLHVQHLQTEEGLTEIASSALCSYPCQYGLIAATNGELHYETRRLDMAAWAEANGRSEPVFRDFCTAAAEYMTAHFKVTVPEQAEPEIRDDMLYWLQQVNLAYFAGDLRETAGLDPDGKLTSEWMSLNNLISLYVASVQENFGKDFTHWTDRQ